ncbi:hypothetical protein [Janthinobacterium sp.]|uniref:hypothetical protein n=1 Tax=Janthinobacterium sp. TaxID=1871054 RepID=UPI002587BCA0|nr:hypothetical protein [Janthinobacterium sp.]MCX7291558.1 hypothetical protein [Janthinobacterium sp.]
MSRAQERIRVATSTIFAIRIAPYSSLNFDLFITPIKNIVEAFDNNFDTFRVFLDVFVPQAFSQAFGDASASVLDFSVHIPAEFERAFASIPEGPQDNTSRSGASNMTAAAGERIYSGRERAEWLWRLANGSLLVPLLLALCVMYYGVAMLKEFTSKQNEALMPMLAHQLKLLEEDRIRLSKEQTIPIDALKSIVEHQMKLLEEDRRRLVREPPATKTRKNDAGSVSN